MKETATVEREPTSSRRGAKGAALSRKERSDLVRENILRAAGTLFFEKGYHATSFEDIAKVSSVNKATIYYFFRAKSTLLYEVMMRGLEGSLELVRPIAASDATAGVKLQLLVLAHVRFQLTDKGFSGVATIENQNLPRRLLKNYIGLRDEYERLFRQILQQGIDEGRLAAQDVNLTSLFVMGFLNSITRWHNPKGRLSVDEIADGAFRLIFEGLEVRGKSAVPAT